MTRVLDIDLDFFVDGTAHWREVGDARLDATDFPAWSVEDAIRFLKERCGLADRLPGWAVEQHAEVFDRWHAGIERGILEPPFSVTHVDAHADLGLGDYAYKYVMTELLFESVEDRTNPRRGDGGLADGNWLMFAIACQWVSDLTYVFKGEGDGRPGDLMEPVMGDRNLDSDHIQLVAYTEEDWGDYWSARPPRPQHVEPPVLFSWVPWARFKAAEPYDYICLTRSPEFTPAEADPIYDVIRDRFVEVLP